MSLVHAYQLYLFCAFLVIFCVALLPQIKKYIYDYSSRKFAEYFALLKNFDKTRCELNTARHKEQMLEIEMNMYYTNKMQTLERMRESLEHKNDMQLTNYAVQRSRLARQKHIDNILHKLKQRLHDKIQSRDDSIGESFDECMKKL